MAVDSLLVVTCILHFKRETQRPNELTDGGAGGGDAGREGTLLVEVEVNNHVCRHIHPNGERTCIKTTSSKFSLTRESESQQKGHNL